MNYYKKELIQEVCEEIKIKKEDFTSFFKFTKKQPFTIIANYTDPKFSFIGEHDYVHHIIFDLSIKNPFESDFKNNKKIKFLKLNGTENKAITAFLLDKKVRFKKFEDNVSLGSKSYK